MSDIDSLSMQESGSPEPSNTSNMQESNKLSDQMRPRICLETGYPSLKEMAAIMAVSSRTLRRHLKNEGLSYSDLLNEAKVRDATALLKHPELKIREVSELLFYGNPSNFVRAFLRLTGQSPSEYRESLNITTNAV